MKISNIEIKNFKSFKNMSVSLNDFNVVVGQSASGKSNFVEAFDFLKDIAEDFEKGVYDNGSMLIQNLNCNHLSSFPEVEIAGNILRKSTSL